MGPTWCADECRLMVRCVRTIRHAFVTHLLPTCRCYRSHRLSWTNALLLRPLGLGPRYHRPNLRHCTCTPTMQN